ncbi:NADP-dependent oxidoreductase domain-containing protein [Mycena rebaudengoi]|nr:NADP-dependent oxidoreductase domain-containing protein [Mycena rebaudengoi]
MHVRMSSQSTRPTDEWPEMYSQPPEIGRSAIKARRPARSQLSPLLMSSSPNATYTRLGNAGLRVSVPIMGCLTFGSSKSRSWVLDEEPSHEVMKAAWDRGLTTWDTANIYCNGESERVIGSFLKKYNIPRHKIIIATKIKHLVVEDDIAAYGFRQPELRNQRNYVNQDGLSRAAILNAVDASLRRLDTPYIDLLQIHRFDPETPIEETMKALHDLVLSGKVRYLGASSMHCWRFAEMNNVAEKNGWTRFVSMQSEYSLLYREEEREMIPYCKAHGIGLIPWRPLASGALARPRGVETARTAASGTTKYEDDTDADRTIIARVEELAKKKGCSMSQISLAWVKLKVDSPIVGISSAERLEQSLATGGVELTSEEVKYLEEPYVAKPVRGHRY